MFEDYISALETGELNGYGFIDGLTDGQISILCDIATAVSKTTISTREKLKEFSNTATHKIFDRFIQNVMFAYDELVRA